MYDLIGDIHGHADHLEALLLKMGYTIKNGSYAHPDRKVLFVGDYIDRGPKIRKTLKIVRRMVESGNAIALMGNHEYNAICFHYPESEGGHLRKHEIKNIIQHFKTLKQFENRQDTYNEYIDWFKTLPLYYETEHFRAVHACWDDAHIDFLRRSLKEDKLTGELIFQAAKKGSPLYEAVEIVLKGKEIALPEGITFKDKDGAIRKDIRIKWWENPARFTFKQLSVEPIQDLPDEPIDPSHLSDSSYYAESDKPVFFGHYWLKGNPSIFKKNICCLDYSVAKCGYLVAYRYDNEEILSAGKLVYV